MRCVMIPSVNRKPGGEFIVLAPGVRIVIETLLWTRQPRRVVAELDFQRLLDRKKVLARLADAQVIDPYDKTFRDAALHGGKGENRRSLALQI